MKVLRPFVGHDATLQSRTRLAADILVALVVAVGLWLLVEVAHAMRAGKAITVAPVDQSLTTQEAANFLGISRPTLVKLLESGEIPFERPGAGRHRRVRLQDVVAYQERKRVQRRTALDELTREAADAGLYDSEADYTAALKAARKQVG